MEYSTLGKEEEFNLFEKYKKYKDKLAYNKIINSHLRIIYKIISKYKSLTKFEQDDLFSYGYIGLLMQLINMIIKIPKQDLFLLPFGS